MKYPVLLIDCPWSFSVWAKATGSGRSAESHYPTMSPEDLMAIPLDLIAADDCVLLMWATWPILPQALSLGAHWGFTYKTAALLWAKTNKRAVDRWVTVDDPANWFIGLGYYSRSNTEPVLLFTKGKPRRRSKGVSQLLVAPISRHSEKPAEQYDRIESLFNGPYCELFARQRRPGWVSLGNEIDGLDICEAIHLEALKI